MKKSLRILGIVTAALCLLFIITGCKAKSASDNYGQVAYEKEAVHERGFENLGNNDDVSENKSESALYGRKKIKSADIEVETIDYDKSLSSLEKLVSEFEGFIQNSKVQTGGTYNKGASYRRAEYTIRIPAENLDKFLNRSGEIGNVISKNSNGEDISDQYFDTQAHLEALKIQEERLLELLKKADKLSDILDLEKELTSVRYQIEQLTGSLKKWDALIDLSTVNITIEEVVRITEDSPNNFWGKLVSTFKDSVYALGRVLETAAIVLTALLPFVITIGFIALIVLIIIRVVAKKKK